MPDLIACSKHAVLSNNVQFDDSCLEAKVKTYTCYKVTTEDSCTKIELDGSLIGTVSQGRFRLLEAECQTRGIATKDLCNSIPEGSCQEA